MVRLIKSLDMLAGSEFRRQSISNYQMIERALNDYNKKMTKHQSQDINAHSTKQIKEGVRSQADINKDLQSQIGRLAVAPRNNSANEVVQARVNMFGDEFETLKENINDWQERTHINKEETVSEINKTKKEVLDIEYRFDPDKQEFQFVTNLSPFTNAVMQHFWIDNRTGLIYMTQARAEGYLLNRLKPNGQYIDSSMVVGGGHGTHNAYRYIEDELWVYSYIKDENNDPKVVRFKYKPNVNYSYGSHGMIDVYEDGRDILPIINEQTNEILFRIEYPSSEWSSRGSKFGIEIRDLDDIDKIKVKFDISLELASGDNIMQGVELDEGYVYWWTGTSNPSAPKLLTVFNKNNGKEEYQRIIDIGGANKTYDGNFSEPEGMQIYYDYDTGKKVILLGITTGSAGERTHNVFGLGQRGIIEILINRRDQFVGMTDTGGRIKPFPISKPDIKNLTKIRTPGHYYLYTNDTVGIDDFPLPAQFRDAGWYFDVMPQNTHGDFRQILTRNSYGRNMIKFERTLSAINGGVSEWNYISSTAGKIERLPSFINKMSDLNIPGMTFYITTDDTKRLSDFPTSQKGIAGWVVENKQAVTDGFMQIVYRYNFASTGQFMIRNYSPDGNTSNWTLFMGEEVK